MNQLRGVILDVGIKIVCAIATTYTFVAYQEHVRKEDERCMYKEHKAWVQLLALGGQELGSKDVLAIRHKIKLTKGDILE